MTDQEIQIRELTKRVERLEQLDKSTQIMLKDMSKVIDVLLRELEGES